MGSGVLQCTTSVKMLLLCLLISVFGVIKTHGQCDYSPLKYETTVLGARRTFCEYQVKDGANTATLKVLPETTFKTLDCHTCSCNNHGLRCCPTNRDPRSLRVPPHCRIIMDGCVPTPVRKSDNRTDCYSQQPVQVVRQNRQRINKVMTTFKQINNLRRQQQTRGGEAAEAPNLDEMLMMMTLSGAFDSPYQPVGMAKGPVGMGGGAPASGFDFGPPFMNDMMPLLMFGMLGS